MFLQLQQPTGSDIALTFGLACTTASSDAKIRSNERFTHPKVRIKLSREPSGRYCTGGAGGAGGASWRPRLVSAHRATLSLAQGDRTTSFCLASQSKSQKGPAVRWPSYNYRIKQGQRRDKPRDEYSSLEDVLLETIA
eukprot:9261367-Pyramimonas_sp.AAC.1